MGLDRIDDAVAAMSAAEGARTLITFAGGGRP
jgi:hypothetical protein